jgi:flagellar protein FlaG
MGVPGLAALGAKAGTTTGIPSAVTAAPSPSSSTPEASSKPEAAAKEAMAAQAAAQQLSEPAREALAEAARVANEAFERQDAQLRFVLDEDSKRMVVKLVDSQTQQVLRQFPSEEMLAFARSLERRGGSLVRGVA